MKKVIGILTAGFIVVLVAFWKSIDTKVIKKTDEVISGTLKQTKKIGSKPVKSVVYQIPVNKLSVEYSNFTFVKNGISKTIKVPNFSNHSVFKTKLPDNLLTAKDKPQFSNCLESLRKEMITNEEKILEQFRFQNAAILKRDKEIFELNKKDIFNAESKMIEATKAGNKEEQKFCLKKLRSLTNNITFIEVPNGKPMKILNEKEILKKQKEDIMKINGEKVFGFIWHHNENEGVMELVAKDVHEFNKHKGGKYIWGGVR